MPSGGKRKQLNKKEKEHQGAWTAPFFLFNHTRPERTNIRYMIRLFTALCKGLLEIISEEDIFNDISGGFNHYDKPCPRCGAVGKYTDHGDYDRGLTYLNAGKIIDARIRPLRFKCESCNVSHAVLPDIVIPYGRYNLSFVLKALIAYYERKMTVVKICEKLGIAVSTLYEWKKRILLHKELMLGLLVSSKTPVLAFLRGLIKKRNLSKSLNDFFRKYGFSFMQNGSTTTAQSHPP
jgi:transposase-like protein